MLWVQRIAHNSSCGQNLIYQRWRILQLETPLENLEISYKKFYLAKETIRNKMLRCFESLFSFNEILIRMKISGNQKHIFWHIWWFSINHVVDNFPKSKASFCYIKNQALQQHMFLFKHIILGDVSLSKLQT